MTGTADEAAPAPASSTAIILFNVLFFNKAVRLPFFFLFLFLIAFTHGMRWICLSSSDDSEVNIVFHIFGKFLLCSFEPIL